jgi:vacuolar-type H+-ATPase subunit F/Vma7
VSLVAAIGEDARVVGYALSGVVVHAATEAHEVHAAWAGLSDDIGLLIVTSAAHAELGGRLAERPRLLLAVMPD